MYGKFMFNLYNNSMRYKVFSLFYQGEHEFIEINHEIKHTQNRK